MMLMLSMKILFLRMPGMSWRRSSTITENICNKTELFCTKKSAIRFSLVHPGPAVDAAAQRKISVSLRSAATSQIPLASTAQACVRPLRRK
ncbi:MULTISPECIES: hypothetical protein [unclassified Herbaspirillum]|uniref:hypothetical protein n=1 Tax=unclassified Herbaspirillum TaxID=2624150 RepID=UPI00163AC518|nr:MULTISPECIES: hypothetical protein [unclassified Herbaspirillum]